MHCITIRWQTNYFAFRKCEAIFLHSFMAYLANSGIHRTSFHTTTRLVLHQSLILHWCSLQARRFLLCHKVFYLRSLEYFQQSTSVLLNCIQFLWLDSPSDFNIWSTWTNKAIGFRQISLESIALIRSLNRQTGWVQILASLWGGEHEPCCSSKSIIHLSRKIKPWSIINLRTVSAIHLFNTANLPKPYICSPTYKHG